MILQALHRYAEQNLDTPPPLYVARNIRYLVALDGAGTLLEFVTAGEPGRGLPTYTPRLPVNRSGPNPKPLLLADNAEYALGIGREDSDPIKVTERHGAFTALLERFIEQNSSGAEESGAVAVLRFLNSLGPNPLQTLTQTLAKAPGGFPEDFNPALLVTFAVDGQLCVGSRAAETFWAAVHEDDSSPMGICSVTGQPARIISRMPGAIRGVPGGQPSGTKLVAVNQDAFESMGYEAASGASISRDAAIKIDAALNFLLANPETSFRIGETVFIHFTGTPSAGPDGNPDGNPSGHQSETTPIQALRAVFTGRLEDPEAETGESVATEPGNDNQTGLFEDSAAHRPLENRIADIAAQGSRSDDFFALTLAANSSRIIIRDFARQSLVETLISLSEWFAAQRLVAPTGSENLLSRRNLMAIYQATLSDAESAVEKAAKAPADFLGLVRSALSDQRPALGLLRDTMRRIRLESGPTPRRAQLVKLLLTRRGRIPMNRLESLDSQALSGADTDAYTLGRLLSHLVSIQRSASGEVGRNMADRFYGLCQTNPSVGFGKALNASRRGHLRKLRAQKPGLYNFLNKRLEEILDDTPVPLPKTLSLEHQGLFALGYYHQGAKARREAQARVASRQSRQNHQND